jgi:hypothetical protein
MAARACTKLPLPFATASNAIIATFQWNSLRLAGSTCEFKNSIAALIELIREGNGGETPGGIFSLIGGSNSLSDAMAMPFQ